MSPRNHLNLLNGRVALIERPVFLSGKGQDPGKIPVKVDFQLALLVRRQFDPIHERTQDICLLSSVQF